METASAQVAKLDQIYREMDRGAAAEQVLKALDPMVERRLGVLLDGLRQCPPELGPLLDFRAQICELWRIRKELKDAGKLGKAAMTTLENIVVAK